MAHLRVLSRFKSVPIAQGNEPEAMRRIRMHPPTGKCRHRNVVSLFRIFFSAFWYQSFEISEKELLICVTFVIVVSGSSVRVSRKQQCPDVLHYSIVCCVCVFSLALHRSDLVERGNQRTRRCVHDLVLHGCKYTQERKRI